MSVVSGTDLYRGLASQALVRAAVEQLPAEVRRLGRPQTRMVVCNALRLEGHWGIVSFDDVIPRSHPCAVAHPEWFEPTNVGGAEWGDDVRTIPSAKQPRRGVPPPQPSFARTVVEGDRVIEFQPYKKARFTIYTSWGVFDRIREEVGFAAPYRVETGGHLYSFAPNRVSSARIVCATGPGHGTKHRPGSLRLVPDEFPDHLRRRDFIEAGGFHSHPDGGRLPSTADMKAWARLLFDQRHSRYVGIIVTPGRDGGGIELNGWVVEMDTYGKRFTVSPAFVDSP